MNKNVIPFNLLKVITKISIVNDYIKRKLDYNYRYITPERGSDFIDTLSIKKRYNI